MTKGRGNKNVCQKCQRDWRIFKARTVYNPAARNRVNNHI